MAETTAKQYKSTHYLSSAKSGHNVDEIFTQMVKTIHKK
jgi:hypothetical protein